MRDDVAKTWSGLQPGVHVELNPEGSPESKLIIGSSLIETSRGCYHASTLTVAWATASLLCP